MADSPNATGGMLDEFRRQIGDTSPTYVQCEVVCDDPLATKALVEVTDSDIVFTVEGGTATGFELDLTQPATDTIEKLCATIRTHEKFSASVASDGEGVHASSDLEIIPPKDCLRRKVQLRSRRWSDSELETILSAALIKLNRDTGLNYTLLNVPSKLKDLLFLLGTIGQYWDQINNATKRRAVDFRVEDFRTLHQSLLDEYDRAIKAYKDVQPPAIGTLTQEQIDEMTSGEVIIGTQYRRNLRTQRITPSIALPFPAAETILATVVGGGKIRLDWSRSHSPAFHHYEVWRGTTADVSNISEISRPVGALPVTGTKIAMVPVVERTLWVDGGTSPLPPGTYYYRLYVYDVNGNWSASDIVTGTVV